MWPARLKVAGHWARSRSNGLLLPRIMVGVIKSAKSGLSVQTLEELTEILPGFPFNQCGVRCSRSTKYPTIIVAL